jgi:hypothetical protein
LRSILSIKKERDWNRAVRFADSSLAYPMGGVVVFNTLMHPVLTSCHIFITVLGQLAAALRVQAVRFGQRPEFASKAVAGRLARGLRMAEAYLRRLLIVMALEIEPTLVDTRKPLVLRRGDGIKRMSKPAGFRILDPTYPPMPDHVLMGFEDNQSVKKAPKFANREHMPMKDLYQRLDRLSALAADPFKRANRLAVHLARRHDGVMMAPDLDVRSPPHWGTEARFTFDALAHDILDKSKRRPPPQAPPQRYGPSVISFP